MIGKQKFSNKKMELLSSGMIPVNNRIVVDFPAPFGPKKPNILPFGTFIDKLFRIFLFFEY